MKVNVIVRSVGIYSEEWLRRQLSYSFIDQIFCTEKPLKVTKQLKINYLHDPQNISFKVLHKLKVLGQDYIQSKKRRNLERNIEKGDVLLFHYLEVALGFKALIESGDYRVFVYCHGYDLTENLRKHESPGERYHPANYAAIVKELSNHVDYITNSHHSIKLLQNMGVPDSKVHLNYYGIPEAAINTERKDHMFRILFVGRLVDFKGPDRTITAFEKACDKGMKAELIIAGDGPMRVTTELMRTRSKYKDYIHILGAVDAEKVNELMHTADIFTAHNCKGELTNQEEAFGVSVVEAMSYGVPVVGTKSGGLLDSVKQDETGILVEPMDVEAHSEALLRLYSDASLRAEFSNAAVERVKNNFSDKIEFTNLKGILLKK